MRRTPLHLRQSCPFLLLLVPLLLPWMLRLIVFPASGAMRADRPPNIIFILADDLGIGDLGAYGQSQIRTPHLDRLAREGMRFTRHYSGSPVCAPSRCVLLTGSHPGHAQIRDNRELKTEGQIPLASDTHTLPRLLQRHGYVTGAFGKWGLGGPDSTGHPLRQGFDEFYGYLCQRVAHNHYPTSLWHNTTRHVLNNAAFAAHQRFPTHLDPKDPHAYTRFSGSDFAPDLIAKRAVTFLRENRNRPFFLYFPTTLPHLALQAPADALARYEGAFPEHPYLGHAAYLPHPTPRAAYAAMVSRIDDHVGALLESLDQMDLAENTIVIFTSDNGPLYDQLGGTDTDFFQSAQSWRGRKGSAFEGGLRVPCLVRWPNRIAASSIAHRLTGFEDWLPTLLDLVQLPVPKGVVADGVSFAPTLLGRRQRERSHLYREFPGYGGWQVVWQSPWKLIGRPWTRGDGQPSEPAWELFDLNADPAESRSLAREHPGVVTRLQRIAQREHTPSETFPLGRATPPPAR